MAALSLATDLGIGVELEHGLQSTVVAMRLCDRLGADRETASQAFYATLLLHIGCTADAEVAAEIFGGDLSTYVIPALFGSPTEMLRALVRTLPDPGAPPLAQGVQIARRLPRAGRTNRTHLAAVCEVGLMLSERLGLPVAAQPLFAQLTERWDGKGFPGQAAGDAIPLPVRIAHVARDAALQRLLHGAEAAARIVRERAGGAFDPAIARLLADDAREVLALDGSAWDETLAREPDPPLLLRGEAIDRALAAIGDFADLASPYLAGHSAGVAALAAAAAERCHVDPVAVRRAALVHDVGRVAVSARIWQKPGALSADERERVRLHAYHSERILSRSPQLAEIAAVAGCHHERLDGSGYHRGAVAATLPPAARLLAAADAYHAMTEPRPHRAPLSCDDAAAALVDEGRAGRLDADAVVAVLDAAGRRVPRIERPAGLTEREVQVIGLLARGLQTKQVARALGISAKTADRHVQNAYAKIGVSTRAAATLFAMEHGLTAWGELPISRLASRT
jgi:HD-GYP domain-containing protein (c-di-GMP phosphodiesterase class II)